MTHTNAAISVVMLSGLMCSVSMAQAPVGDALEQIEGVRGGRHWINQPTAPPRTPQDSLDRLQIEPGYDIQLVAHEPLVQDPVGITFDDQGHMFVMEYGDYPVGPADGDDPLSRIVLLLDNNSDGVMDARHVFADKLNFAHSIMAWNNGLLVGAHSEILYLRDTDGDHVADIHEVLFDGFRPAHPQMQIGCPQWGIDNWISLTYGPGDVASSAAPETRIKLPGRDFRFDPQTMKFEADSGLGQFGNTVDRWGRRFFCTNRDPIITTLLPPDVLRRNPFTITPRVQYSVGKAGGDTRVYPLVDMKSNYLSHAGTHTAACGVTACLGDLGTGEYRDSVFVCEPIGHLVTRSVVAASGSRLQARRARPRADFVASTDTWFRPVSLATGPDGSLYLADMYRLWVEHPKFLPPEIAARIDWRAGDDRGRIYRIVPTGSSPRAYTPSKTLEQRVALLEDANGWRQYVGQRLLVERQETAAVPLLRNLLRTGQQATTRLHVLWTLDGLGAVAADDLEHSLRDSSPEVRCAAVRLSGMRLPEATIADVVGRCVADPDPRVRLQVAVALGKTDQSDATELLIQLACRDGEDSAFVDALLTSVSDRSTAVLRGLLKSSDFTATGSAARIALVGRLAEVTGARGDRSELTQLADQLTASTPDGMWWRAAGISGLGRGLTRHRGGSVPRSLASLIAAPPAEMAGVLQRLGQQLESFQEMCLDSSRPLADRAAAVELLSFVPIDSRLSVVDALLSSRQPTRLQFCAVRALSGQADPRVARILIARWPEVGPTVRPFVLATLQRRAEFVVPMLDAMRSGDMNASALSVDQRVLLLKHSNQQIQTAAREIFGGAVSENRAEVVRQYRSALQLSADVRAGAQVFKRVCARCHRVNGVGHEAGPDISDVRNRSQEAILFDVLDPNAKVEPQFTSYTVVTQDGQTLSGLLASESDEAIVLRMPESREQAIVRGEIDELRASSVSLMPEGIEKDVTLQNMADLLAFLKQRPQ